MPIRSGFTKSNNPPFALDVLQTGKTFSGRRERLTDAEVTGARIVQESLA